MAEDVDYESIPNSSLTINMIAGALAGITEHTVMYPLDSIKTRMQVLAPSKQAIYSGVSHAFSMIYKTEGLRTFWKGINSVVIGAGPSHALYFSVYERCKSIFGADQNGSRLLGSAAAGACATIAADALMNPFDVIKQRMQIHGSQYRHIWDCSFQILRKEGVSAFYVSYPTTLMMTIPFQSVQFSTYEYFRQLLNPSGAYDPMTHVIAGGIAGAVASAITTPLDVAKTLLQTRGSSFDPEIKAAHGMRDAFRLIYKRNGLKGYARGLWPRMIAHMPSTAICWVTYEYFQFVLKTTAIIAAPASQASANPLQPERAIRV